jgi:hypothetical protein
MGLFKSKDERRIEREMKMQAGLRSIERPSASRKSSPTTSSRTPAAPSRSATTGSTSSSAAR